MSGVRDAWVDSGFPLDFGAALAGFASDAFAQARIAAAVGLMARYTDGLKR